MSSFADDKAAALAAMDETDQALISAMRSLEDASDDLIAARKLVAALTCAEHPIDPPIPPQQVGKAVSIGSADQSRRYNHMADFIDLAKLPLPAAFDDYFDKTRGIIAPSQNGVLATRYFCSPLLAPGGSLYVKIPTPMPDGTIQSITLSREDLVFADSWKEGEFIGREGPRGTALVSPYITWKGHPNTTPPTPTAPYGEMIPNSPGYIGVRVDGAIMGLFFGSDTSPAESRILGYVKLRAGDGALDMALYPPNRKIFYVAVHNRDGTGRIIKIDRTAAISAKPPGALEDGKLWVQTDDFLAGVGALTGIVAMDDGTLYAADNAKKFVYRIKTNPANGDWAGGTLVIQGFAAAPFSVEYTSTQQLVVMDVNSGVYVIDPSAPGPYVDLMPAANHAGVTFGTLSVDRNGTFGERDTIAFSRSHGAGNTDCYFFTGPGWSTCRNGGNLPGGQSTRVVGDTLFCVDLFGHYVWVCAYHPTQGVFLTGGYSNSAPKLLRVAHSKDPARESWDHQLWNHGLAIIEDGSVAGSEQTKPSWTCQMDITGGGLLGFSSDHIANMSLPSGEPDFAAMKAFIQAGGIGSFPRPEIQKRDLLAILYYIMGCSQRLIREGQPLLDKLFKSFPPEDIAAETPGPVGRPFDDSYKWVTAEAGGGKIVVMFRNKVGEVVAHSNQAVVKVVLDEDLTIGIANQANNWTILEPATIAGQHSLTCVVTSAATPDHVGEASVWIKQ